MSSGYSVQKLSETLSKISPFSSLTSQQRVSVLEVSKLRQYKAGMDLCREGEASRELFILLSGSVAVIHNGHIIAKPQPVTCIGEMGVFTGEPRSATVRAESQTLTIVMTKEVLDNIINTQYRIGITLLQDIGHTLSMRQRESNKLLAKYRSLVQQLEAEKQDLERMIMEKRSSTGGQKTPAVQQPPVQDEPAAKQSALEKRIAYEIERLERRLLICETKIGTIFMEMNYDLPEEKKKQLEKQREEAEAETMVLGSIMDQLTKARQMQGSYGFELLEAWGDRSEADMYYVIIGQMKEAKQARIHMKTLVQHGYDGPGVLRKGDDYFVYSFSAEAFEVAYNFCKIHRKRDFHSAWVLVVPVAD